MVSKKEHFGVFRADNNPAKREVNPLRDHLLQVSSVNVHIQVLTHRHWLLPLKSRLISIFAFSIRTHMQKSRPANVSELKGVSKDTGTGTNFRHDLSSYAAFGFEICVYMAASTDSRQMNCFLSS